ncbi:alanine racemase [Sphingosinicella sp.]|uniref:alanine racemase n=1 Tax=Sphingosinicella sp. TaxID=1917971 RepID=UPI004037631D
MVHCPLRLTLDGDALVANWHWLAHRGGGAACGAAVKADGYGLGAREVVHRLQAAGCRDFFVSTWAEAAGLMPWPSDLDLVVLHGVGADDMTAARASPARPLLNSPEQVARWKETGRPCDVMIDTGMNRLGLTGEQAASGLLDGLAIDTLMSHLACGDEESPMNEAQRAAFVAVAAKVKARRLSLANSAGVCLGPDFAFDLTRPGLALYGGVPRAEAEGHIRQVARIEAQIVQRRQAKTGQSVGYGASFIANRDCELAIVNLGYADGYLRGFSGTGRARIAGGPSSTLGTSFVPVVGRVSMDLTAIRVDDAPELAEGDWLELDFHLPDAAGQSGLSQYELLTCLGARFERRWA